MMAFTQRSVRGTCRSILFFKAHLKRSTDPTKSDTLKVHGCLSDLRTASLRSLLTSLSMPRSVGSSLASTCSLNRSPARVRRYRASSAGFRGIFAVSRGMTATRLSLGGISTRYERMGGSGVGRVVCRGTVKKPPQNAPQKSCGSSLRESVNFPLANDRDRCARAPRLGGAIAPAATAGGRSRAGTPPRRRTSAGAPPPTAGPSSETSRSSATAFSISPRPPSSRRTRTSCACVSGATSARRRA